MIPFTNNINYKPNIILAISCQQNQITLNSWLFYTIGNEWILVILNFPSFPLLSNEAGKAKRRVLMKRFDWFSRAFSKIRHNLFYGVHRAYVSVAVRQHSSHKRKRVL